MFTGAHTQSHLFATQISKQQSHYEVHFANMATEFKRLFGFPKLVQKLSVLTLSLTLNPYHQSQDLYFFPQNFNIIIDYFTPEPDVLFISTWINHRSSMCLFSDVSPRILL